MWKDLLFHGLGAAGYVASVMLMFHCKNLDCSVKDWKYGNFLTDSDSVGRGLLEALVDVVMLVDLWEYV